MEDVFEKIKKVSTLTICIQNKKRNHDIISNNDLNNIHQQESWYLIMFDAVFVTYSGNCVVEVVFKFQILKLETEGLKCSLNCENLPN